MVWNYMNSIEILDTEFRYMDAIRDSKNENDGDRDMKFVLDTNVYLHYKLFTELEWKTLLRNDDLTLIVPPAVIEELDEKKYSAPNTRIKRRAQEVISKFQDASEGKSISRGFQINFLESNIEDVDWDTLRLNPSNSDDRIIAAILALKEQTPDEEILIVTADLGMQLKARNHGIEFVPPPDDWKKETKDQRDNEIVELRAQLQKYQNALPDVQLLLSTGNELVRNLKISKDEILESIMSDEDIKKKMDQEREELESLGVVHHDLVNSLWSVTQEEIERYNKELDEYMTKYSRYLFELKKAQELRLIIKISPVLTNNGSLPAEDIDIFLEFPEDWRNFSDDIELLKETDLPKFPKEPNRPAQPQSVYERLVSSAQIFSSSNLIFRPIVPYVDRGHIKQIGPEIRESEISVRYWLINLKHGMEWQLDPIYVWYSSVNLINTFQIQYTIHIGNHPKVEKGNLVVVIGN